MTIDPVSRKHFLLSVRLFFAVLFFCPAFSNAFSATLRVENFVRIKGQETTMIRGYGIVSGLNATGDDPKSIGPTARMIMRMLANSGVPNATEREIGKSRNNALVEVTVTVPGTGAREGDLLDCTVAALGNAKSLENGVLSATMLAGPLPQAPELTEPLGLAWGKITIEKPTAFNVGKIKNGCRLTADFINPYIEDGNMTLVVKPEYADAQMVKYLVNAINTHGNESYLGNIAKAMNQNYIVVKVPTQYFADPMSFVAELLDIEITLDRPLQQKVVIDERAGVITIGDDVEVRPCVVTHRDITAEIRPPLQPGEQELNPQQFVDIDTETKYRQLTGEAVQNQKLKALQASLDGVRVRPEDMIAIIKNLKRQGAIIGEVIFVE